MTSVKTPQTLFGFRYEGGERVSGGPPPGILYIYIYVYTHTYCLENYNSVTYGPLVKPHSDDVIQVHPHIVMM